VTSNLIAAVGIALASFAAYGTYWLVLDARERKREAETADQWVVHHRSLQTDRYLRDELGRPE
jgi:hypothetical protein